jgi:hypothetical protein
MANLIVQKEFALDWIADLIAFTDSHRYRSVEPTEAAVEGWVGAGAEVSELHTLALQRLYGENQRGPLPGVYTLRRRLLSLPGRMPTHYRRRLQGVYLPLKEPEGG